MREKSLEIGIKLEVSQINSLKKFAAFLIAENQKYNLISGVDESLIPDHFLDSLTASLGGDFTKRPKVTDIGSGAGFPGVVIKIAFPEITLTLIESRKKRAGFLRELAALLDLNDIMVLEERAEDAGRDPRYRENSDIVLSRAVARLRVLLEYALPLMVVGGRLIALKGAEAALEVEEGKGALRKLGGEIKEVRAVYPIAGKTRNLVIVEKTAVTPIEYPRRSGIPSKRPIK